MQTVSHLNTVKHLNIEHSGKDSQSWAGPPPGRLTGTRVPSRALARLRLGLSSVPGEKVERLSVHGNTMLPPSGSLQSLACCEIPVPVGGTWAGGLMGEQRSGVGGREISGKHLP